MHNVTYSVFTEQPFRGAEIYYRDTDPPSWADYSHDPYLFSPNVEADLGPGQQWTLNVQLANPDEWAMVMVDQRDVEVPAELSLRAGRRRRGGLAELGRQGRALLAAPLVS